MANNKKLIDGNGLLYFWQKIISKFVAKEEGKGLSSNDYTTAEADKLRGIDAGANKTIVENNLTSTSQSNALRAAQGKILDEKIKSINTNMKNLGAGDMLKSVYDIDNNGQVDRADDADKLGGQAPGYYAKAADIPTKTSQLTNDAKFVSEDDIAALAPGEHTHEISDVNGLTDALAGKSDTGHKHTSADITDFGTQMDKKANATHSHAQSDITGLSDKLQELTEVAQGKRTSYVFDDEAAMNAYIAIETNKEKLQIGDAMLIRATDVPDYWWDGTDVQIMETRKFNLETLSNAEIDEIVAS